MPSPFPNSTDALLLWESAVIASRWPSMFRSATVTSMGVEPTAYPLPGSNVPSPFPLSSASRDRFLFVRSRSRFPSSSKSPSAVAYAFPFTVLLGRATNVPSPLPSKIR